MTHEQHGWFRREGPVSLTQDGELVCIFRRRRFLAWCARINVEDRRRSNIAVNEWCGARSMSSTFNLDLLYDACGFVDGVQNANAY